jgi:ABC-2 type transport system permease protein
VAGPVFDSQRGSARVLQIPRELVANRSLLALLVRREIVSRYKRSSLGLTWTVLNPLLEMSVLWLVFSHVFRFSTTAAPYVVYLLSGLVLLTLFRETVVGVASSMVNNAATLSRIYVPVELFCASAATVVLVNFAFGMVPLVAIMLLTGTTLVATLPLVVIPAVLLVCFGAGLGLTIAPAAVRYPDLLHLVEVALTLVGYLAPMFYPFSIVPAKYRIFEQLNPLYHFVGTFRNLLYTDSLGSPTSGAVMVGSAVVALSVGAWVLTRFGRRAIVAL